MYQTCPSHQCCQGNDAYVRGLVLCPDPFVKPYYVYTVWREILRGSILQMVDLNHFMSLIFADACTLTCYILYNQTFLPVLFSWLGDHPRKPQNWIP